MRFKLFKEILEPKRSYEDDAGLDLFLPEKIKIRPFQTICIDLGIGFEIPKGYAGMLVPRSSIAKKGIISQTQALDCGYTGEIHLIITNCSFHTYKFNKNDRIVSLVVYKLLEDKLEKVNEFQKTKRGNNGLGSSGL